jgi:hypothetical protein
MMLSTKVLMICLLDVAEMDVQTLSMSSGMCMAKTVIVSKTLHKHRHTWHQNVYRYYLICFVFGRGDICHALPLG